jgi:hypothetical protein
MMKMCITTESERERNYLVLLNVSGYLRLVLLVDLLHAIDIMMLVLASSSTSCTRTP